MVPSDASDKLQSCENLASSGGSQATQAQDAQPCTGAEPEATGVSGRQQRKSSPSLCSSTPLATSEDCISSSPRGCDDSHDDESSHDQIAHSLEHERASSCSLYPQSCCSSAMGRAGSTSVVDVRNTVPASRTGQSQDVFFPHRQEEGLGHRDEGTSWQMQALEFQAIGACRTDERLKPLLRWNVSCCGADGRLLAHLGQHFKARELAMLARCLCAPLVSIRVGKVSRRGHLLCPTTTRGYLSLRMLLSSDMQLTFVTDAGITERIPVLSSGLETSGVILEHLAADLSGRSFVLKSPGHKLSFFWQSEISKAVGDEMVCKMKDLLKRQPSLSQLTGIHETRLDTFASYLRSALVATSESTSATGRLPVTVAVPVSSSKTTGLSQVLLPPALTSNPPVYYQPPAHFNSFKTLLPQFVGTQLPAIATSSSWTQEIPALTSNGLEVCCSTRGSSTSSPPFLEPAREIQHLCTNLPSWSGVSSLSSPLSSDSQRLVSRTALGGTVNALWSTRTSFFQEKTQVHSTGLSLPLQPTLPSSEHENLEWHPERTMTMTHSLLGLPFPSLPETLYPFPSMVGVPASNSFLPPPLTQVPISTSLFSPYYCPCPLGTTTLQYTNAPPFLPAKIGDVDFVPTASPFFTVRPPPALVPSSALGMQGVSFSPAQLTSLPLVTAAIPLKSLRFPPFFTDSNSHVPLLNIHVSKQNCLVQLSEAAAVSAASGVPSLLPEYLPLLNADSHVLEDKASLRPEVSTSWEALVSAALGSLPVEPVLSQCFITSVADSKATMARQHVSKELDGSKVCCDPTGTPLQDIGSGAYEKGSVGSSLENAMHLNLPSQQSRPVLGIVPTLVNRTSVSHVFSFCPDLLTKASGLAQGGLTLVNNASELVGSRSSTTTISRGVQSSQAISCDPTHAILCAPEPKSMADSTSLHKHRSNHEEKPK